MKAEVTEKEEDEIMKIGAIFLVSVMALAAIGGGYAAWFDTITIQGTVNTGNVDLVVKDYSGTWVYKDLNTDLEVIDHAWLSEATYFQFVNGVEVPCTMNLADGYLLVAYGYSYQPADAGGVLIDDAVFMTYGNLFPCIDFVADVLFHYEGSIPVKVNMAEFTFIQDDPTGWLTDLWNLGEIDVTAYRANPDGTLILDDNSQPTIVDVGTQLHYCDYVLFELHIHLPQYWSDGTPTDDLMLASGSFGGIIEVVQWNEYPYTHPP